MTERAHERSWYALAVTVLPAVMVLAPETFIVVCIVGGVAFRIVDGRTRAPVVRVASNDLLAVGLLFAGAALVSAVVGGGGLDGGLHVVRFALVPVGFVIARAAVRVDLRHAIWLGAVVGSLAAATAAVAMLAFTATSRPTMAVNPIHFGEMALVLGAVSVVSRRMAKGDPRTVSRWTLVAVSGALTAAILSHSRGGWIAVPVLVLLALWHHRRSGGQRIARYLVALSLFLVPVVLVAVMANDRAALRALDRGFGETVAYVETSGADETAATSIGTRFEMWRSAFAGFRQDPGLGIGWGRMDDRFAEDVAAGVRNERMLEHDHPHNQYLSHLASGGIVGLASLLALLGVPALICARAFLRGDESRCLGGVGLVVISGYAVFALTDSVLESASPLAFYVLSIGTVVAQIDRLASEHLFAYHPGDGLEQPQRAVVRHRTDPL